MTVAAVIVVTGGLGGPPLALAFAGAAEAAAISAATAVSGEAIVAGIAGATAGAGLAVLSQGRNNDEPMYTGKQNGKMPRNNDAQKKQVEDAIKEAERQTGKKVDGRMRRKLHENIHGEGNGYHEILEDILECLK